MPFAGDLRGAFIHFDRLPGDAPNYFCRVWSPRKRHQPDLEIEPITGQPWQRYDGTCVICVLPTHAEIIGILKIPHLIFWKFRRKIVEELGVTMIAGDVWDEDTHTKRRLELNLTHVVERTTAA